MTVYKFEHNWHSVDPTKDTYSIEKYSAKEFKDGYVLIDEDGEEAVIIGKSSIGMLNGARMYLLENDPETFIEALVKRAQENIEFHTRHLETLLQRKMRCVQMLNEAKAEKSKVNMFANIADAVEYWHNNETGTTLQEFLGFTDEEYEAWGRMSDGEFEDFLNNRKDGDEDEI